MPLPFTCKLCRRPFQRHFFAIRRLCRHIEIAHQHEANFTVSCNIDGCPLQYQKVDSYKKHISRHHANIWQAPDPQNEDEDVENQGVEINNLSVDDYFVNGDIVEENDVDIERNLKRSICLLSHKLQEKHVIPRIVVDDVCTSVRNLMLECVEIVGREQHDVHVPQGASYSYKQ